MELLEAAMKWLVAPLAGFLWLLHNRVNKQSTDIAVIQATTAANKEAHDREFKEMRENFKAVIAKLDDIERALRK